MNGRTIPIALASLLATATCGCGITNPYQPSPGKTPAAASTPPWNSISTTTPADVGDPPPERGGTIPAGTQGAQDKLAADATSVTAQGALVRYASLYVNWQASNLVTQQRKLASISLGQARAQALQAAASAAGDPELTRSQVANQGQLIAMTPGAGAAAGEWVLVTRERTAGQGDYTGLPATLHVIYAQLTHNQHGWIVTQWQPQT